MMDSMVGRARKSGGERCWKGSKVGGARQVDFQ